MSAGLTLLSAGAQARGLARGRFSAVELLEAHLSRIAAGDGAIGAFWTVDFAGARAAARASDERRRAGAPLSPFDGVPVAAKDNLDVQGLPATGGIAALRANVATRDAPAAARLRAAGLVFLGKLAMHEGALGATNDTPGFGRCQNPLRPGFTPGGSSGGSGAATAAHFTPLAIGTDTMGSVRIPAAYCGVHGLKPTCGLVSRTGCLPLSTTLDTIGMLARTARDALAGVRLMAGFDAADPQSVASPRYGGRPIRRLGVPDMVAAAPMEPAIRAAFEALVERARLAGFLVTPIAVADWEPSAARKAGLLLAEAEAARLHAAWIDDPEAASPDFRAALRFGRDAASLRLMTALDRLERAGVGARRALFEVDALLLPTAPQRAFAHGTPAPADQADFTALANIAGLPALAFPLPAPDGGLPASAQLVGQAFSEARLVAAVEAMSGG